MDGFWRLSNARPIGMHGLSRIPLTEVEAYCRLRRFSYEKTQEFLHYVEKLDAAFMEYVKEEQEKEEQKRQTTTPPPLGNRTPARR